MSKLTKRQKAAVGKVDSLKLYTFDDAIAQAKSTYNASIADELAAYREDRASTKSQVARLLVWRGFVSATRDEQRVLNRATDAAKRDLALDQDAAYEIFDLEVTDETVALGRSDFRSARTVAEKSKTLALRAVAVTYEEAVDVAVLRLADSLADMAAVLGPRPAAVARDLTKLYEECVRGSLAELAVDPRCQGPKGEIVIVVAPGETEVASEADADAALAEAMTRLPPGEAAAEVSRALNLPRKPLYRRALEMQGR